MRYLLLLMTLLCCSCIQLGGPAPERDYYRLASLTTEDKESKSITSTISLELVDFPEFLNKSQIVTRDHNFRVLPAENAYWAEPLGDNVLRTLRVNLKRLAPQTSIYLMPWESGDPNSIKVALIVNDFSAISNNQLAVDVDWTITKNGQTFQGRFIDNREIGASYSDLAAALSESLAELSRLLSDNI